MGFLDKFFKKKGQTLPSECVLIHLDAANLPDDVYRKYDLSTLEDQLIGAIQSSKTGEFDGNEIGNGVTTLYTYGPDADRLYRAIESVLRAYPLCRNARVVIQL
jgi:hypothetical protein